MKRSPLGSIFLIVVVDVLGFTIILPLLPFYAERFGATPVTIGILLASYGLCQLIAGPILGSLSDRWGRKPVLLLSQAGTFIGFLILAFAHSLPMVFLGRIIDGLTAGNLSVAQAYIADVTEPKNRAKSFGLIGIAFGLGFLIGPAISGLLTHFDYHWPIFAAAALSATSILATWILLPNENSSFPLSTAGEKERVVSGLEKFLEAFRRPELGALLWQFAAFIFAFAMFMSGFALFAERRFTYHGAFYGAKEVSYVFAYVGLIGVIIQARLMGPLVRRFGEGTLVKTGFLAMVIGSLTLGLAHSTVWLLVAVTVSFLGSSVLRPSLTSLITQKVGRSEQGMTLGLTQSLMSIAQIIAPLVSGFLIHKLWLTGWAWSGSAIAAAGFFLIARRKIQV